MLKKEKVVPEGGTATEISIFGGSFIPKVPNIEGPDLSNKPPLGSYFWTVV